MALEDSVLLRTRGIALRVSVNGVLLTGGGDVPAVLSLEYGDAYDTPPYANVELNTVPSWLRSGLTVEIDAGINTDIPRQFTGFVTAIPGEEPEFLRDLIIVDGATITVGTPPDDTQSAISATATLVGADIRPPLPDGTHIAGRVQNHLIWDGTRAALVAQRILTDRGRVPGHPGGAIDSQTIECHGPLYNLMRQIEMAAIDAGGMTDEAVIELVLDRCGITNRSITEPPDGWYTLADDAEIDVGSGNDQLADVLMLSGLQFHQTAGGITVLRYADFFPAPTASFEYSTDDPDTAYIVSADGITELAVTYNPTITKGMTGQFNIPHLNVDGRFFVYGVRHVIPRPSEFDGPTTYLRLRGGNRLGGTVAVNPVASFTFAIRRQVIDDRVYLIYTLDGSDSVSLDGTITDWDWTITTGSTPVALTTVPAHPLAGKIVTFIVDPADIDDNIITSTLTVTGDNLLTHATSLNLPNLAGDTGVTIAPFGVAGGIRRSISPNGGETYNNTTPSGKTATAIGARPADGVNSGHFAVGYSDGSIDVTRDYGVTYTAALAAVSSQFNYIAWDWRDTTQVWAITEDCRLYRSTDAGVSFAPYKDFRSGVTGAVSTGTYVGNGTSQDIELGVEPSVVIVHADSRSFHIKTDAMPANTSIQLGNGTATITNILSLNSTGFSLGSGTQANGAGITYHYVAFKKDPLLVKTGAYAGSGADNRDISGVGFQPKLVTVFADNSGGGFWRSDTFTGDKAKKFTAFEALQADFIQSFAADGFQVGSSGNTSAKNYYWVAFASDASLVTGSYTGTGTDNRDITGTTFIPKYVLVGGDSIATPCVHRFDTFSGDQALTISTGDTSFLANEIQALNTTGFQVGLVENQASGSPTYHWFAFGDTSSLTAALGNLIGLPAAGGVYIFGGSGDGYPLIAFMPLIDNIWYRVTFTGDLATDTPADATMRIEDYTAPGDGMEHMILSWASGGGASLVAIYYTTSAPGTSRAFSRATGLTAGLKTGRIILSDAPLAGQYVRRGMFADRDVWPTTNGIAFTKTADVLPAGYTPNHGLFESDVITGLIGMQGVYLIAAEDAAGNGGIFKSTDALATLDPIYGAGATYPTPTYPVGEKPKQIAIGAVAGSVSGESSLIVLTEGTSPNRVSKLLSGTNSWSPLVSITSNVDSGARIWPITSDLIFATDEPTLSNNVGAGLYRSGDGGATWAITSITDGVAVCRAADGRLWAIGRTVGPFNQTKIYRDSLDDGATWNLIATIGNGTTESREGLIITAHPLNADIIAVWGPQTDGAAGGFLSHTVTGTAGSPSFATNTSTAPSRRASGSSFFFKILANGRWVIGVFTASTTFSIVVTDDKGATAWVSKYSLAGTGSHLGLGVQGSKLSTMRHNSTTGDVEPLVSPDSGETWEVLAGIQTWEVFTGHTSPEATAYDPISDTWYVGDDNQSTFKIVKFSPTTTAGVWSDVSLNLPDNQIMGQGSLAVIP